MQSFALVDYDNVKVVRRESSAADVFANVDNIIECITSMRREGFSRVGEIVIRLYGGWTGESGNYTQLAQWLLAVVGDFRGRRAGMRVRPELAFSLISAPLVRFVGTHRRSNGESIQKLVDSMIAVDLVHLGEESDCPIIVYSDDDDLIPAILYSALKKRPPALLRSRAANTGLNDHAIGQFNLLFSTNT